MADVSVYELQGLNIGLIPGTYSLANLFNVETTTVSVNTSSDPTYLGTTAQFYSQPAGVTFLNVEPDASGYVNVWVGLNSSLLNLTGLNEALVQLSEADSFYSTVSDRSECVDHSGR